MDNSKKIQFLKSLTQSYQEAGIRYCFLRSGSLAALIEGDDIDIVVDEQEKDLNHKIIQKIADDSKFRLCKNFEFNDNIVYTFFIKYDSKIKVLNLHFQFNLRIKQISISFKNQIYLRNRDILKDVQFPDGYPVIANELYAYALIIHAVYDKGFFKEEYKKYINESIKTSDRESLYRVFKNYFPGKVNKELMTHLFQGDFSRILENKNTLFHNPASFSCFILYFVNSARRLCGLFKKMFRSNGVFLAILGPDGSGKSTIIQELHERIEFKRQKIFYLGIRKRSGLLKFLPTSKKTTTQCAHKDEEIRIASPCAKQKLHVYLRTAYHMVCYSIVYYFKIFPYLVAGYVVIGDRYFHDLLILRDAQMPRLIKKAFLLITPSPTFTVLLKCDPETIRARKAELSVSEIDRQLCEYAALGELDHTAKMRIFENLVIDITCEQILQVLWKELNNKHGHSA